MNACTSAHTGWAVLKDQHVVGSGQADATQAFEVGVWVRFATWHLLGEHTALLREEPANIEDGEQRLNHVAVTDA